MEIEEQKDKKEYEIGFLASDETGASAIASLVARFGGEVTSAGAVERIMLAYPIARNTHAHFGYLHCALVPTAVPELKDELLRTASVIRSLIITPPFVRQAPRQMPPERMRSAPRAYAPEAPAAAEQRAPIGPLSNEALEKRIEEIMNA